jgi:hypothetical protein
MYNSNKLGRPKENDLARAKVAWEQEKKDILARNEYLSSFNKESDRDLTLLLSVDDIKEKIYRLYDIHFHDVTWIYDHFKDAMVTCKVLSSITTFRTFATSKYPMFFWLSEPDDKVELKFLSGVTFDIVKTIEIMNNLFADRQLWLEYKGDNNND